MRHAFGALFLVTAALLACKLGGNTAAASCDARTDPDKEFCFEYPKDGVKDGEEVCKDFKGTWAAGKPCDHASSLGGCALSNGNTKWFYAGTKLKTTDAAKLECSGKWLEPSEK